MPAVRYDRYYTYEELTETLDAFAEEASTLFRFDSIGQSYEGRDIWLATVTNTDTGPDTDKPAFLVDANIHSIEVTGCTAALHLLHRLVTAYGSDEKVTRALDSRAFYVIPRLNPDGAELALAERPRYVRSSVRPYPLPEVEDGLHAEDVDGDGRILTMRLADPNGNWKQHRDEPRMMVRRDPDEDSGEYFRILPEGTIRNYDGVVVKLAQPLERLDLNRNFPGDWGPEAEQLGSGPYPTSEPEIRAMVQAVIERPNICGHVAYHTFGGLHLRPYATHPGDHFPTGDLRAYQQIGDVATSLTGYPSVSVFHDFKYDPKQSIRGSGHDFMYDQRGVFSWTTEFWSPQREAGIEDYKYIEWLRDHPPEDDLKLYAWANVPFEKLEAEVAPHTEWAIFHCLISPRLEVRALEAERVGEGVWKLQLVLENTGWLPTNVSDKAVERNAVRALEVEVELPEGARLVSGEKRTEAGQLTGRVHNRSSLSWGTNDATTDRVKLEWVVESQGGGAVELVAKHQRAGTVRRTVTLA